MNNKTKSKSINIKKEKIEREEFFNFLDGLIKKPVFPTSFLPLTESSIFSKEIKRIKIKVY